MANKYVYEISANTSGYVEGVDSAKKANASFTTSIDDVVKENGKLKKELGEARRNVMNLSLAYKRLGSERQKSAEGKALLNLLNEEKKKAAELQDMFEDVNKEIKMMASDTAAWDMMKEGITVSKNMLSSMATTIGTVTGKEDEMSQVVKSLAKIETTFNAVISIGNALQKQSALMTGIRRVQSSLMTKAIIAETTATKGATVAQKAFNVAAKANPYVLLATAIIAVGAAMFAFVKHNNEAVKAQKAEEEVAKSQQEAFDAYKNTLSSTLTESITKYKTLQAQWKELRSEHEKNQFIKNNAKQFDEYRKILGKTATAEELLNKYSDDLIAAMTNRARAAAYAAQAQALYQQAILKTIEIESRESQKAQEIAEELKKGDYNVSQAVGTSASGAVMMNTYLSKASDRIAEINKRYEQGTKDLENQRDALNAQGDAMIKKSAELNTAVGNITSGSSDKTDKDAKAAKDSITGISNEISKLQQQAKDGLLPDEFKNDPEKFKQKIAELTEKKAKLELEWGFKDPEKATTMLQQLQEKFDKAKLAYQLAVEAKDEDARQAALEAYYAAQEELENHKLEITPEPRISEEKRAEIKAAVNQIVEDAMKGDETKFDFQFLPEIKKEEAEKALEQYNKIKEARQKLTEMMNKKDASDTEIAEAQRGIDELTSSYNELSESIRKAAEESAKLGEKQKATENLVKALNTGATVTQSLGSALGSVGDALDDNTLRAGEIIANTIATILQGYATATAQAATMGPWAWIAFSLAGLGQVAAMVAQIKQLSAGSYADGGVVPGTSYTGDRLIANVNSGERILTARQNENFEKLVDSSTTPQNNVTISSIKVRGSDLVLAIKNELKTTHKTL